MKTQIKRLLALILAMAMSLSLLGANVWAAELEPSEDGAVSAQSSEESTSDVQSTTEKESSSGNEQELPEEDASFEVEQSVEKSEEEKADQSVGGDAELSTEEASEQAEPESKATLKDGAAEAEELPEETQSFPAKPYHIEPQDASEAFTSAHMWYSFDGNIDIRGYKNGEVIQTTYDDYGYSTVLSCDGEEDSLDFDANNQTQTHESGLQVKENVHFSENGDYAIVTYTVSNPTNVAKKYSLGVHADVDIQEDDYAVLYRTSKGVKMVNKETNTTYFMICKGISGYPSANTLWIGYYGDRTDNIFTSGGPETLQGTDSAFAFSWKDRIITAGSSTTYVYQVGIGESGAIAEYNETGKGFVIGKDSNSFSHSASNFFHGSHISVEEYYKRFPWDLGHFRALLWVVIAGDKVHTLFDENNNVTGYYMVDENKEPNLMTYHTSDSYFNRLASGLKKSDKGKLQHEMNAPWGGSCHGIAVSMALASQGILGESAGIDGDYHSSEMPKDNPALRNTINFYQLSQYVPRGRDTVTAYKNAKGGITLHDFLTHFAQCAVEASTNQKPFVFSFGHGDSGHSIVVYGASETSDGVYSVDLYDENSQGEKITMTVNCNDDSFSFTDGNDEKINQSNFKYVSFTGQDDLYGSISTLSDEEESTHPVISVTANKRFTITNDRGETLSFSNDSYSGSMNVYKSWMTGEKNKCIINFEVSSFSSLTMTDFDKGIDLEAEIDGEYYSAEVDGANSVVLKDKQINISGDNYVFKTSTTAGLDHSDLTQVSAMAMGDVTLSAESGKLVVDSEKPLYGTEVSSFENTTSQQKDVEGYTSHMELGDGSDGQFTVEATPSIISLDSCIFNLSDGGGKYIYDGMAKTPSVSGLYGSIPLIQNQDYTITYSNNVNAGVATVVLTGCGSYEGTASLTFTIQKVGNVITAKNVKKSYQNKAQSFRLGVKTKYGAQLTYRSNNKNITVNGKGVVKVKKGYIGKATVKITANANQNVNKTVKRITVTVTPAKTIIQYAKAGKGSIVVTWKKNATAKGYEIQVSTKKNFKNVAKKVKIKKNSTVKTTIKKLKKGAYYVRIRTINGKTYSGWSKTKTVKVK